MLMTDRTRTRPTVWRRIWLLYYEGFRDMTTGRRLWIIILVKLFIMFAILKVFFFPDLLSRDYDSDKDRAAHVRHELTH